MHDDAIKRKHFPCYCPFVRGIHRSPVYSPHKGQWRGAMMFSLICVWINGCVNNREAGNLRRYRAHYNVTVMSSVDPGRHVWVHSLRHVVLFLRNGAEVNVAGPRRVKIVSDNGLTPLDKTIFLANCGIMNTFKFLWLNLNFKKMEPAILHTKAVISTKRVNISEGREMWRESSLAYTYNLGQYIRLSTCQSICHPNCWVWPMQSSPHLTKDSI